LPVREIAWPEGTPNWVDLSADNLEAAKAYYAELFGWDYLSGSEDAGGYLLAQIGGKAVAGLGPKQDAQTPTVWTTFLASDDVDATAAKVAAAGGELLAGPFNVMDSGRMAIAADTGGAVYGVWEAKRHIGAERFNEHGALCWNELHTRDYGPAHAFYGEVFDFSYNDISEEGMVYSTFKRPGDGEEVGGVHHDTQMPDDVPNYWLAWFASDDVDATAAKAEKLGSTILMPVMDTPFGRMAVVQGAQGEVFGIIKLPVEQA
jgi:uncharacterized protein